jgi:hypothetical protein
VDPFTRQLFPENIIPANRISPVYRNVVPLMPLPNQTGTQNLAGTSDTDHNEDQFFTRIDHKITDNDRLFGRYVYSQLIYDQSGLNKAFSTLTRVREQNVALNWTHVFSPTILNEVRLGYQRSIWTDRGPRTDTDFDAGQVLGISGIQTPSGTGVPSNLRGYPTFQVQGFLGLSDGGRGLRDLSETRQFVNNLSVTRSAHNLKMGVDLRLVRDDIPGSNVPRSVKGGVKVSHRGGGKGDHFFPFGGRSPLTFGGGWSGALRRP